MVDNLNGNYSDICRACLDSKPAAMEPLFSDDLYKKYIECTSLKVLKEDMLPNKLCKKCSEFVVTWYDFKEQCRLSETMLLEHLAKAELDEEKHNPSILPNTIPEPADFDVKEEVDDKSDESVDSNHFTEEFHFDDSDDEKLIFKMEKKTKRKLAKDSTEIWPKTLNLARRRIVRKDGGMCAVCEKVFSYKKALATHLQICGKNGKRVKKYCPELDDRRFIPKSDALLCGICKVELDNYPNLKKHLDEHKASNDLACKNCDFKAVDFADLVCVHRYTHQEKGFRLRIRCYICFRRFGKIDRLEFHFRGAHLGIKPGLCKECGKVFMNMKNCRAHRLSHAGIKIECHICHKTFAYNRSLVNHMRCHSDVKEFICHLCGFACKAPAGLASHHFRMHTDNQPMPCEHCGKKFKNKETLREHLLRVNGERNFECPHCRKRYRTQKELEYHQKWHSDEKPFSCKQCGKSYKSRTHLKNHMRMHTGERPYECSICSNTFMTSSVLKKHKMIHSGERPHVCVHCGKAFIEKSNLKNHMKTHKEAISRF